MILVKTFYAENELRNFSYLILNDQTGNAWVIDPFEASPLIEYIKKNNLVLKGILNTHQHWDHVRGNERLSETFHAPVRKLKSSDSVSLSDNFSMETLDTPGHTLDHQAFLWKEGSKPIALFSGDTLFNSGVGNCRGGGDVGLLFETTERLKNLPKDVLLYPGHDYRKRNLEFALTVEPQNKEIKERLKALQGHATEELPPVTLGEELRVNPFLRLNSEELRQNVLSSMTPLHDQAKSERELFIKLRHLRDNW